MDSTVAKDGNVYIVLNRRQQNEMRRLVRQAEARDTLSMKTDYTSIEQIARTNAQVMAVVSQEVTKSDSPQWMKDGYAAAARGTRKRAESLAKQATG